MAESSITQILTELRQAVTEDERQAAAAKLYRCYRGPVEQVARGRLLPGGGLADEEDVAQSAFRSFFDRIETGQLDALVTGGQAWAILARLTRNKAIDSVRYDNALCRGGEGSRRSAEPGTDDSAKSTQIGRPRQLGSLDSRVDRDRLKIGDAPTAERRSGIHHAYESTTAKASRVESRSKRGRGRREDYPLDAVRDRTQLSGEEQAASNEAIEHFLEQLSEATLRGIVSLKLHGFTNEEIAERLGCATRTVERKLNLIRRLWVPILENSDEQRQT